MIKAFFAGIVGAVLTVGAAAAQTMPMPLPSDPRIRQYVYDVNTVYQLDVYTPYISTIQFAEGEIVESIQIGDSASWQIVRLNRGDVLSVKPLMEGAFTNMTVYTDRRLYTFDLRAHRGSLGSRYTTYRVTFVYPSETVTQFSERRMGPTGPTGPTAYRRTDYHVAGEAPFAPTAVYDDGRQTVFTLPPDAPRPAIFRVDAQGRESIVNVRHAGADIIVDTVSDRWTMRIGDTELCVASGNVIDTVPARLNQTTRWQEDEGRDNR